MSISETMTVNDAIRLHPESVGVFNALGVDACCGGAATLAEAAGRDGVPLTELLRALASAAEEGR